MSVAAHPYGGNVPKIDVHLKNVSVILGVNFCEDIS